ncbi:MAG: hypothetical protein F6J87_11010 [Spirulina sp. SIO3F2]|nr:hypothetical protein [Spirulina sp. SIO3F2]
MKRPLNIKIITILQAIGAAISFLIGIEFLMVSIFIEDISNLNFLLNIVFTPLFLISAFLNFILFNGNPVLPELATFWFVGNFLGCSFILLSFFAALLARSLWRLKTWSWRVMLTIQFLSVMASFFGLFLDIAMYAQIYILNLAIALPLFIYFSQNKVKRVFNVKEPTLKI